jgi:hypothetical protein
MPGEFELKPFTRAIPSLGTRAIREMMVYPLPAGRFTSFLPAGFFQDGI